MNAVELDPNAIVGRVTPDERKRVGLGRYLARGQVEYQVFRFDDGKTLVLRAIEEAP